MNSATLFIGMAFMAAMATMTYLAEGSFVGARPYAAAATTLMFMAMASHK